MQESYGVNGRPQKAIRNGSLSVHSYNRTYFHYRKRLITSVAEKSALLSAPDGTVFDSQTRGKLFS